MWILGLKGLNFVGFKTAPEFQSLKGLKFEALNFSIYTSVRRGKQDSFQ